MNTAGLRVVAAPDKFRGSASASDAARAIAAAATALGGSAVELPLADGGEGTLAAFGGPNRWSTVTGPLGKPVVAGWRLTGDGQAIIEMALASGLLLAGGADRNDPWAATTAGTGELVLAATDAGASRIIVGLGGSATTDGGLGALRVITADRRWDPHGAGRGRPDMVVCCDVNTPFSAAANIFGPQKGADRRMVADLRKRLTDLENRYLTEYHVDVSMISGAGAAGGLAGALTILGGTLVPGFALIADSLGLDNALRKADLVITGEGRLDAGSFDGKVVGGVAARARALGVPVVAVVGEQTEPAPADITVLPLVELFGRAAALGETLECIERAVRQHLSAPMSVGGRGTVGQFGSPSLFDVAEAPV